MTTKRPYKKLSIEDCKKVAKARGGKCLSKKYISIRYKMKWTCDKGHIWESKFINIRGSKNKKGTWCPTCSGSLKLSLKDAHKYACGRNGKCLSKKYTNNRTKMQWECMDGHIWKATLDSVQQGKWCPVCSGNVPKPYREIKEIIYNKGGKIVVGKYTDSYSVLSIECGKCKHVWDTTLRRIKKNCWCPKCAGNIKYTLDYVQNFVAERNGKCLSAEYVNGHTNMEWQCEKGHTWRTKFMYIKRGTWCPSCSAGKSQNELREIIGQIFPSVNIFQNYRGFDWLRNKKKMEIDIWVPKLKIAIEYDGRHHFSPVEFGGMSKEKAVLAFKEMRNRDRKKESLIKKHTNEIKHFIRFSYKEEINKDYVMHILREHGILRGKGKGKEK